MLAEEYAAAVERAGKVYNIVRSMSLNAAVLQRVDGALQGDHVRAVGTDTAGAGAPCDRRLGDERVLLLTAV